MNNIEIRAYRNTINFNLVTPNSAILTVGCSSLGDLSQTSRFRINGHVSALMIRSIHFRTIDTLTLAEIQNEIHGPCDMETRSSFLTWQNKLQDNFLVQALGLPQWRNPCLALGRPGLESGAPRVF